MDIEAAKTLFAMMGIDPLANIADDDVVAIRIRFNFETHEVEVAVFTSAESGSDTLVAEAASILADADKNGGQS